MEPAPHQLPVRWSPIKAAVVAFVVTVAVLAIGGAVIIALTAPPGTDFRARGERFGQGVGPFAIVIGVIVYFRQAARIRRDREPPRAQVR